MDKADALSFLASHQPMPDDKQVTKELLDDYRAALQVCHRDRPPECISLFLKSFGERDLFGNYSRVVDVLRQFPTNEVVLHILDALNNSRLRSVRYWNAQAAQEFPDRRLIGPLAKLLLESDVDLRSAAVLALAAIKDEKVEPILATALSRETESDIRELILESIGK
jgi:hypothetical protein